MLLAGAAIAAAGGIVWLLGHLGFRGLPGDVRYESAHARFYFPIVSCVVLSLILCGLMWLWRWFAGK
jgi:hypothetical protein